MDNSKSRLINQPRQSVSVALRRPELQSESITNQRKSHTTGNKCQYCDKSFIKSYGMQRHLLENCEKIPASARRQLLKKMENCDESDSKTRRKTFIFDRGTDPISKNSRFFATLNGSFSMQAEVENELRKIKGAHLGITRTPSKAIKCHLCKKSFFNCVTYADHIANHPSLN